MISLMSQEKSTHSTKGIPEIILLYNSSKEGVAFFDEKCAKYLQLCKKVKTMAVGHFLNSK